MMYQHNLRYWPFVRWIHWSLVNSPHKGQMCPLMCVWTNGWTNTRFYMLRRSLWHKSLLWHHDGRDGVSNQQPHDRLLKLNCLFRRRSKYTSKLRVTGRCAGNSPVTSELPEQTVDNTASVSIWWRHKNIERHTAHTIVSWLNLNKWVTVHTSDLMMIIRQSIYIRSIMARGDGKLKTHSPTYCIMDGIMDNWDNMLDLTHTLDKIYMTGIL